MELSELQRKNELKKHTSAIHSSNTLSLLQRKISNALLAHAYDHLNEREEHKISIRELCLYLGYKGRNYDVIKKALKALITTVIEWNLTDDETGEEDWTASSILASVNIKGGVCSFAYSSRMRDLLFSPSMYGRINLLIQSRFTSSYGLALYENCIRYKGLPQTKVFEINIFRNMMGVPQNKYQIFRDFKRRVLDKAVDEVNSFSDILIEPIIKRIGRKVASIQFNINVREKRKPFKIPETFPVNQPCEAPLSVDQMVGHERLIQFYKISNNELTKMIDAYGEPAIIEKMVQVESTQAFLKGQISNIGGYLIDALKNGYQPAVSKERLLEQQALERKRCEKEEYLRKQKEEARQAAYREYSRKEFDKVLATISDDRLKNLQLEFKENLQEENNYLLLKKIQSNTFFSDELVKVFFKQFLDQFYPSFTNHLLSFEEFQ